MREIVSASGWGTTRLEIRNFQDRGICLRSGNVGVDVFRERAFGSGLRVGPLCRDHRAAAVMAAATASPD
jgi:hypothetical protein